MMRPVPGYEGIYSVTDDGRVYAHPREWTTGKDGKIKRRHDGRWLSTFTGGGAYLKVNLKRDGKERSEMVHRLVASAFVPNPHDLQQVNHIDGVKTNNNASNLEWCTAQDNKIHAVRMGLCRFDSPAFIEATRRNLANGPHAKRSAA